MLKSYSINKIKTYLENYIKCTKTVKIWMNMDEIKRKTGIIRIPDFLFLRI